MTHISEITLDVEFPHTAIPTVLMQPLIEIGLHREPYCWMPDRVEAQCRAVQRTMEVARDQRAGFTVLPEYSVPGLAGAAIVNRMVHDASWHTNSVVIAGLDGLDSEQYRAVWDLLTPTDALPNTEPNNIGVHEWVNCCAIWVKEASGRVRCFIQPKLTRAWPEQQIRCAYMRSGDGAYLFLARYDDQDGYPCRFLCLICYDWIGVDGTQSALERVLVELNAMWHSRGTPMAIHWVFVPQCNDNPCDHHFLTTTNEFFLSTTNKFVERRDAVVVHSNSASRFRRARSSSYGFSSLIFHPDTFDSSGTDLATVSCKPKLLRGTEILARCQDVIFREMGPCIHVATVRVPRFRRPDSVARRPPLDRPEVYALVACADPRLPGGPVPASTKWLHDRLDEMEPLCERHNGSRLSAAAVPHFQGVVRRWRDIPWHEIEALILFGTCDPDRENEHRRRPDPDEWSAREDEALETVLYSSTIAAMAGDLNVAIGGCHACGQIRAKQFDLDVVCGHSHRECRAHFDRNCGRLPNHHLILITRDQHNDPMVARIERKITCVPDPRSQTEGVAIANPDDRIKHLSYREVLNWFILGQVESDIGDKLYELL